MHKTICLILSALLFPYAVSAQGLKVLADDQAVTRLTLPDGIPCYLVSNTCAGNTFDAAIVQKATIGEDVSNKMLTDCEMLHGSAFGTVLSRNGLEYGREGIIEKTPDGNIIRFSGFESARPEPSLDTLLYAMVSFIGKCIKEDPAMFGTDNQAIVIAGSFDKGTVSTKLKHYSMNVPSHKSTQPASEPYLWTGKNSRCILEKTDRPYCQIEVSYLSARCRAEDMNTVLPPVTRGLACVFGNIVTGRLAKVFEKKNIPVANLKSLYKSSGEWSGDEKTGLSVCVPTEYMLDAVETISSTLGDLERNDVGSGEMARANGLFWRDFQETLNNPVENSRWVDRCADSFLYGADLASDMDKLKIFTNSDLDHERNVSIFNKYKRGLLDSRTNLEIICKAPFLKYSSEEVLNAYLGAWMSRDMKDARSDAARAAITKSNMKDFDVILSDTIRFVGPSDGEKPFKPRKTAKEVASGGTQWLFPNGMRVIYKNAPTNGLVFYSLVMNGGRSNIDDAKLGETAFLADVFGTFSFAERRGDDFMSLLAANQIIMNCDVDYSTTTLSGFAPTKKLPMVLSALLTVSSGTEASPEVFDYWYKCEKFRLMTEQCSQEGRLAEIDARMIPGFWFPASKQADNLAITMLERAEAFFKLRFSRANDGELLIVTDQEEGNVLKTLQSYMPQFRTEDALTARAAAIYRPVSGESDIREKGSEESFEYVMAGDYLLSPENKTAALVAGCAIEGELRRRLEGTGLWAEVKTDFVMAPKERLSVIVSMGKTPQGSMGSGCNTEELQQAEKIVKSCINELSSTPVADPAMNLYKAKASSRYTALAAYPKYWLEIASFRAEFSKDYNTNIAASFNAVSSAKVREIIDMLGKGGRISYLVTK